MRRTDHLHPCRHHDAAVDLRPTRHTRHVTREPACGGRTARSPGTAWSRTTTRRTIQGLRIAADGRTAPQAGRGTNVPRPAAEKPCLPMMAGCLAAWSTGSVASWPAKSAERLKLTPRITSRRSESDGSRRAGPASRAVLLWTDRNVLRRKNSGQRAGPPEKGRIPSLPPRPSRGEKAPLLSLPPIPDIPDMSVLSGSAWGRLRCVTAPEGAWYNAWYKPAHLLRPNVRT